MSWLFRSPCVPLGISVEDRVLEIVGLDSESGLEMGDSVAGISGHEGRGTGTSTTPRGREKHAYFWKRIAAQENPPVSRSKSSDYRPIASYRTSGRMSRLKLCWLRNGRNTSKPQLLRKASLPLLSRWELRSVWAEVTRLGDHDEFFEFHWHVVFFRSQFS